MEYISSLGEWAYWTVIIAFGLAVVTGFLHLIQLPFRAFRRYVEGETKGRDAKPEAEHAAWKYLALKFGCMMRGHPC